MDQSGPSLSRREFALLSASTASAVLAPGTAGGRSVSGAQTTDRYDFLMDHVEASFAIPTLVRFADESGFDALDDLSVSYRTHTDGTVAAHAHLTPEEAATVVEADETEQVEYAPGSNPFWTLGDYDEGVFLPPEDSVDFIGYEEARAGLDYLESRHSDRLRVQSIGTGAGHRNVYEGRDDPRAVWTAELTENIDDEAAFTDKEKIVFSMSVHGDERAGIEACLRFAEELLEGDRPELESLLSGFVLVFVSPNPDGWVVRERIYEDPVSPPDFRRFNATDNDPNRQYPNAGWVNPDFYPAEARGRNLVDDQPDAIDDDVPAEIREQVPATLAVVEHLREYENVEYFLDTHGMYAHTNAVLSLNPGGGTPLDRADSELLNRRIESELADSLGTVEEWSETFELAIEDMESQVSCNDWFCTNPGALFGYGTAPDSIGYSGTGFLDTWAALPGEYGGLGATSLTTEIVFSNSVSDGMRNRYLPEVTRFHVDAYSAVCKAFLEHATDDVDVTVRTSGRSTAFLASSSLTRSATELPHVEQASLREMGASSGTGSDGTLAGPRSESTATVETDQWRETASLTATTSTFEVPASTHTVELELRTRADRPVEATVSDSSGQAVRRTDGPGLGGRVDGGGARFTFVRPDSGEWTIETRALGGQTDLEIRATALVTSQDSPDPRAVLGYEQRDYEVTPFAIVDDLDAVADGTVDSVTADGVRDGALVEDGEPAFDNLVVVHAGLDDASLSEIQRFVEAGGNLVLTDAGVTLAAELDVAGLDTLGSDAVPGEVGEPDTLQFADYGESAAGDSSHPLFEDRREFAADSWVDQREPWQYPALGYTPYQAPMYWVDESALSTTGANIAFASDGTVRLATVPTANERVGVHLLGSLLPPATQENLHPFGLLDHSLTLFGYQLLCNALGYQLQFSRNGEPAATLGSTVGPGGEDGESGDSGDEGNDGVDEGDDGDDIGDSDDETSDGDESDGTNEESGDVDDTPTDSPDDTPEESADGDGPGFGITAGLAGLGGAGYLLKQRLADETGSGTDE